jgi:hypothetical protein
MKPIVKYDNRDKILIGRKEWGFIDFRREN